MIQNNLDPEVAGEPRRARRLRRHRQGGARLADASRRSCATLRALGDGRDAARAVRQARRRVPHARSMRRASCIANSNLVPKWATWEHFHELDRKGLMMYGQMTAGLVDLHRHARASCRAPTRPSSRRAASTTAAISPAGGSSPPASAAWAARSRSPRRFAGASSLNIECQQSRIDFRLRSRYLDEQASDLDDALARIAAHTRGAEARCLDRPARQRGRDRCPSCVKRARAGGIRPDLVTDQTSAHDLVNGYLPAGWTRRAVAGGAGRAGAARVAARRGARRAARRTCEAMLDFQAHGHPDRRLRQQHPPGRVRPGRGRTRSTFPGFVPAYIRPLFCRGKGPFRWVALSGDPEDIRKTDAQDEGALPATTRTCTAGSTWPASASRFQGLPARICWIGLGERHRARPRVQRDGASRAS
mgnify:CR=1 FL=1